MTTAGMVKIEGETYPHRAALRKLGAVYRKDKKDGPKGAWWITADKVEQAQSIVSGAHAQERGAQKQRAKAAFWGVAKPAQCKCMNCGAEIASGFYCPSCK